MMIDKLGSIDPVQKYGKSENVSRPTSTARPDTIDVSPEARAKSEIYMATEIAKAAPEVRLDRVEEVKLKLQNPDYINDALLTAVAEGILKSLGI